MPKEDIVGGLALAIQKGESLGQAMMSFLNSGYKNEEIQEAARMLQSSSGTLVPAQQVPVQNKTLTPVAKTTKKLMVVKRPLQQVQPIPQQPIEAAPQSVSLSQHLEGVQDPSKMPQTQEQVQQPIEAAPKPVSQQPPAQKPPQQIPIPFQGTSLESKYESPKKNLRSIMIIILSILLFLLILSLLGVFIFKDILIGLFNKLF